MDEEQSMPGARQTPVENVDQYIAAAPQAAQRQLHQLREVIREAAPQALERISYGMPYYELNGRFAYFSVHAHHIGLYPGGPADAEAAGLSRYCAAKSTLRFPLSEPLPLDRIRAFISRRADDAARKTPTAKTTTPRAAKRAPRGA